MLLPHSYQDSAALGIMSWLQETDDYERLRGRVRRRRRLSVVMFDLFYPLFVVLVVIVAICWYFELPIERLLRNALRDLLQMLF
jgi:hypothetical protein